MGRYTTVQSYGDAGSAPVPVAYKAATGGASEGAGTALRVPIVRNVKGSGAGVGSSYFHSYRLERRREMERVKAMTESGEALTAEQEYHARLELNRLEDEERTMTNADKRRKRKEKERSKRRRGMDAIDVGSSTAVEEDSGSGEDPEAIKEPAVTLPTTAPVSEELLINDGKFMERFLLSQSAPSSAATSSTGGSTVAAVEPSGDRSTTVSAPVSNATT